jgi:hypothetical protein
MPNQCKTCGATWYLVVDGHHMETWQLLALRQAPRKIEHRIHHLVWCESGDHRQRLGGFLPHREQPPRTASSGERTDP